MSSIYGMGRDSKLYIVEQFTVYEHKAFVREAVNEIRKTAGLLGLGTRKITAYYDRSHLTASTPIIISWYGGFGIIFHVAVTLDMIVHDNRAAIDYVAMTMKNHMVDIIRRNNPLEAIFGKTRKDNDKILELLEYVIVGHYKLNTIDDDELIASVYDSLIGNFPQINSHTRVRYANNPDVMREAIPVVYEALFSEDGEVSPFMPAPLRNSVRMDSYGYMARRPRGSGGSREFMMRVGYSDVTNSLYVNWMSYSVELEHGLWATTKMYDGNIPEYIMAWPDSHNAVAARIGKY